MRRLSLLIALLLAVAAPHGSSAAVDDRVRPGLGFSTDTGGCTFGFLLTGSDGHRYASTAGHCGGAEEDERIWRKGDGPVVRNDQKREIGRFVYAVEDSPGFTDFALIRLHKGVIGNPQQCAWGGPTRLLTEARAGVTELHQHGRGDGVSLVAPTREGFARSLPDEPYTIVQGPFVTGDSGSPVTTADGEAMGLFVELIVDGGRQDAGGGVVRLEHAMAAAGKRLGISLTLRTAPLLPEPLPTATC